MSEKFIKGNKIIEIQKGPPGYFYLAKFISDVKYGGATEYYEERKILLPESAKPAVLEKLRTKGYKAEKSGGAKKSESSSSGVNTSKIPPKQVFKKGNDLIEIIFTPPDRFIVHTTQKMTSKSIEELYAKIKAEKWSVEKNRVDPAQKYLDKSLIAAINDKDVKSVVALLENGADANLIVVKDKKKILTPLHQAVRVGSAEIVAALLNMGANPNVATSDMETTPLMNAIWFSDKKTAKKAAEIAKLLISRGADLHMKNAKGHSAADAIRRKEIADKIKDFSKLL